MGYSDLEVVHTPLIGCDRQDFSHNNRVFYIPKTVGFGVRLWRSALRKDTGLNSTIINDVVETPIQRANLLITLIIEIRYWAVA